jgi:hypothetical protein
MKAHRLRRLRRKKLTKRSHALGAPVQSSGFKAVARMLPNEPNAFERFDVPSSKFQILPNEAMPSTRQFKVPSSRFKVVREPKWLGLQQLHRNNQTKPFAPRSSKSHVQRARFSGNFETNPTRNFKPETRDRVGELPNEPMRSARQFNVPSSRFKVLRKLRNEAIPEWEDRMNKMSERDFTKRTHSLPYPWPSPVRRAKEPHVERVGKLPNEPILSPLSIFIHLRTETVRDLCHSSLQFFTERSHRSAYRSRFWVQGAEIYETNPFHPSPPSQRRGNPLRIRARSDRIRPLKYFFAKRSHFHEGLNE